MKSIFVLAGLFFFTNCIIAQENKEYAISNISAGLLENADAVVRDYYKKVEVISPGEINTTFRYTITILNKKASNYTRLSEGYRKVFSEIESINGILYDKDGNEIKELKRLDIIDVAPFSAMLEFDDIRVKHFAFNYSDYPFTVSFEIKTKEKESFFFPDFDPQMDKHNSVEKASMEIAYPANFPIRYKAFHLKEQPVIATANDGKTLNITVADIKAEKDVDLEPDDMYSLPSVIFASDSFELGGLQGRMDTWNAFGKFFYDLNANRNELSDDMKKTVHKLTDTCKDNFSKIKVLYAYLQESTRYVAVELGIGGWQCMDAKSVCTNKYADCKGLSNYMGAMLKEAGINSYGVLIYGGYDNHRKLLRDFTKNAFNHYILCVPQKDDTVWMDCTAKNESAGYLPEFTSDRDALLLTPAGGFVVKTPVYGVRENTSVRNVNVHINSHDSVDAVLKLHYSGFLRNDEGRRVTDKHKEEIEDHFNSKFSLMGSTVANYKITTGITGRVPILDEEISLKGKGNITHAGKRTFIEPSILPLNIQVVSNIEARTKPFELKYTFSTTDTETITIDGKYTAEYIPEETDLNYDFASYSCKIGFEKDNVIKILRRYTQVKGVYPATSFSDYAALTKAININRKQIVLVKKE